MTKYLENINKKLKPYYSLLTMVAFFITLFIGVYKFFISPSDLRVTVQTEEITYPSSIAKYYDNIATYVIKNDTLQNEMSTVYDFLLKTTDFKKIVLKNTSSKTLRGIKFKHTNTDYLTAWSISSDFFTNDEEEKLKKSLDFDVQRNIVFTKGLLEIPPNSQININIWGNFKSEIMSNNLIINYDGGEALLEKTYVVSGLKGYFVHNSFEIFAILLITFILVYYVGIQSLKRNDS